MELLRTFFGWMTLINAGLLTFTAIMCMAAKGMIQRFHGKLFDLSPNAINAAIYGYLGVYKIAFISLNLVPWLALVIMTK